MMMEAKVEVRPNIIFDSLRAVLQYAANNARRLG